MSLKTDYAPGDVLPAADVNSANVQINNNQNGVADNVTALAGKAPLSHVSDIANPHSVTAVQAGASPTGHNHDLSDLADVDDSAKAEGKVLKVNAAGDHEYEDAGGAGDVGGLYGINVETLSADKTLTVDTDEIYQWLDEGGENRIITLATAGATAGDRWVIRHNGVYDDAHYMKVVQAAITLDYIYSGGIKEFIFDGANWVGAENGAGENDDKKYAFSVGYGARGYDNGVGVGYAAMGIDHGVAVGRSTIGYGHGVAVGNESQGWIYGAALGHLAIAARYGAALGAFADTNDEYYSVALGYYSGVYRVGEVAMNIGSDSDQENNRMIGGLAGDTTDATPKEIFCAGYSTRRFKIRPSSVLAFRLLITARDNVTGHVGMWKVENGVIKRDGAGNTVMPTAATVTEVVDESGDWSVAVTADDVNESLKIEVTGDPTNPVQWVVRLDGVETHF